MTSTLYSAKAQRGGRSDIISINNTRKTFYFVEGLFIMPIYIIHTYGENINFSLGGVLWIPILRIVIISYIEFWIAMSV